ncbi:hypothetical protein NDU88_006305 [Pleurodeles waltl]|uniref:Uncharacterized protein n=1 Tax=Pleurodeles waltl TaxID=8319 RepID=A0AAV7NPW3_PLEWA|nr:hypothetical protein NDU88_006305 [Pleurodeles waltl]
MGTDGRKREHPRGRRGQRLRWVQDTEGTSATTSVAAGGSAGPTAPTTSAGASSSINPPDAAAVGQGEPVAAGMGIATPDGHPPARQKIAAWLWQQMLEAIRTEYRRLEALQEVDEA